MQGVRLLLLAATAAALSPAAPLRVMRVTPTTPAEPDAEITVMFDRPVAGGLDATVAAEAIFSIEPMVPGRVEWRDPVTLRFKPAELLEPGRTYTVRVAAAFAAMDGSRLAGDYRHEFRVAPPRALGSAPLGPSGDGRHLPPEPRLDVLVSAPVDPAAFAAAARIVLEQRCGGRTVPVRAEGIRQVSEDDPAPLRYNAYRGGWPWSPERDLRRVVTLVPAEPLPLDCGAVLSLPGEHGAGTALSLPLRTYGPPGLADVRCAYIRSCPTGPIRVVFNTPLSGAEVLRHVRIAPHVPFTVQDTALVSAVWTLEASLQPRTSYAVVADTLLTDVFGQRMRSFGARAMRTTGYAPAVSYTFGRMLVERQGFQTLAVQHVNADTLVAALIPVPDSLEGRLLARSWGWEELLAGLEPAATKVTVPVTAEQDARMVVGIRVPARNVAGRGNTPDGGTLVAVRVTSPALDSLSRRHRPVALVQVTDLAVHARVGTDQAEVWVTGVHDGQPREGVDVALHDPSGAVRARGRTDARGLARLEDFAPAAPCESWECRSSDGYVVATTADDRAVVGVNAYDPDLAPWRFDMRSAWDRERAPLAAAVFTERGIYRPGEPLYAKAIVRRGPLGSLAPARGDSVRWVFKDRESGVLADTVVTLGEFGTADRELRLPATLPLGHYGVELQLVRDGAWQTAARTSYQVAEYRPPEFLVDVAADDRPRLAGDTADVHVSARYLFGAPMANAPVRWHVRRRLLDAWELRIPGTDGFMIGDRAYGWFDDAPEPTVQLLASATDTLDEGGAIDLRMPLDAAGGRAAQASLVATVTDANRQTVSAATSVSVHPAEFYIGARQREESWFWTAGTPVSFDVIAVRPDGERVAGVEVNGVLVRREWHQARRLRDGSVQQVGGWVSDTVAACTVRTGAGAAPCTFTPPAGGSYVVTLRARDAADREAVTAFARWASGSDWVPWDDRTQLKMDIIADRERYAPGDTATLLFASPFTDAEAWITVERERVLESRRIRVGSGATTLKLPITEAHAPNVFVSMIVVRGRSAPPGPLDDPGRPALRVGYAELRVTPEVKRLNVDVAPLAPEYRPGDTASVRIAVRDAGGRGHRAEVTLWAVDQGVLALTGYRTPDPLDLLYPARGVGMRLASNLATVAPQVPEGEKGKREPGGGGGGDLAGILRSRFQTTAFFLGSVVTDGNGDAVAKARLPDNLTTFRVMAVAVTAGDRYGSGESDLLVTRPLVARPALPRFVREGDRFSAGVVLNSRMGGRVDARVEAKAEGIALEGRNRRDVRLEGARPGDVRFEFRAQPGDSARFTFSARAGREADAVATTLPVKPFYHPLSQTVAGLLTDTATTELVLGDDVDPARSTLEISFGTSPLAAIAGARQELRVYPYVCTEQIASVALPLIALYSARLEQGEAAAAGTELDRMRSEIESAVQTLARRQRPDGGIGYWSVSGWTTPWLSAYAGRVLLEAKAAGIAVEDSVLSRLSVYLREGLRGRDAYHVPVAHWLDHHANRLAERVAAVDFLSRFGRPELPAENTLVAQAALLRWEDRLLLAQAFARRGEAAGARALLEPALAAVRVEGRKASLAVVDTVGHYFHSPIRPAARLLETLLLIEPQHPAVGPLVETLVDRGRSAAAWWNTQDHGNAVLALLAYERERRAAGAPARVKITAGRRTVLDATPGAAGAARDTAIALRNLVSTRDGRTVLPLRLEASGGAPVFYYLTVREAPRSPQLEPVDRGIRVERWYERPGSNRPVVSAKEGELVRVRLRVTVPAERHFVVLDDPLPAGLEPVDLSLRTVSPFGGWDPTLLEAQDRDAPAEQQWSWYFGSWDAGVWSPFDHKEMRDDRVVYSATVLWPGTYTATYLARATTAGSFLYPPAHAEEMYNPGVNGRTAGGRFTVERP